MRRTEAETAAIVDHHRALPQYAGRTLVSPNGLFERDPVQWGDACVGEIFRLTKPDGADAAIAITSEAEANLAEEVSFERLTQSPKAALPLFRSDTQAAILAALFADPAAELTSPSWLSAQGRHCRVFIARSPASARRH